MIAKILVLFCHPTLEKSRANKALLSAYRNKDACTFRDLYEEYPTFEVNVAAEQQLLLEHDVIIWHHPMYWYNCPPLLKQWIDMVLSVGWAYGPGGRALEGKKLIQVVTTGGQEAMYQPDGFHGYTIRDFLRPFERTAGLCNMRYLAPFVVHGTHRMDSEALDASRRSLERMLHMLQTERLDQIAWGNYRTMQHYLSENATL